MVVKMADFTSIGTFASHSAYLGAKQDEADRKEIRAGVVYTEGAGPYWKVLAEEYMKLYEKAHG